MELTKEYFEETVKGLASKEDLRNFATKDDLKSFATTEDLRTYATKEDLKELATKKDLEAQTQEFKDYVHEVFEVQQVYIDERFYELMESIKCYPKIMRPAK